MNLARPRVVLCIVCASLVAAAILAVALRGRGGGGKSASAPPATSSASAHARSTGPSPAARSSIPRRAHSGPPRLPPRRFRPAHLHTADLATARAFVNWFDRWLAAESSARHAPDVTPAYAAKLRASANNVPPAARGHVAAVLYLIPVAIPPGAAHQHDVWVYAVTRSQGTTIRFTVRERLYGRRWLVYGLDQGA